MIQSNPNIHTLSGALSSHNCTGKETVRSNPSCRRKGVLMGRVVLFGELGGEAAQARITLGAEPGPP